MNKHLEECEKLLNNSNCSLIHFGCVLVKEGVRGKRIIGRGYNHSLRPEECRNKCLKDKIKNRTIGKNPAICYAVHGEWMAITNALYLGNDPHGSTLYIIGRYPDGRLWKSKYFACTVCSRLLAYWGIKEIIGLQFNAEKTLSMEEAFDSAYEHILKGLI